MAAFCEGWRLYVVQCSSRTEQRHPPQSLSQHDLPAVLVSLQEGLEFHVQDWQFVMKEAADELDTACDAFRQAHLLA